MQSNDYIQFFDGGIEPTLENLGGKGSSLVTMTAAGMPVPPGFVVTTAQFNGRCTKELARNVIDFIKAWMELGKELRSKADAPYQVTASVLAVLTIAAIAADKTPAAIVSMLFVATGWWSGSEWLTTSAPPFLEFRDQGLSHVAVFAFFIAIGILWVLPVIRNRFDVDDTFYDSARLVWSRAAASCWLILLFAAQTGNVQVFWDRIVSETGTTVASVLGWGLGAVAMVWLFGLRFAFLASLGSLLAQVFTAGFNAGANVGLAILAVPVSVPWAVCSWLFTTKSQASIEAEEESARIRAENSPVASGATPIAGESRDRRSFAAS